MQPENNGMGIVIKFGVLASTGLALSSLILYIREPVMIHLFVLILSIIIFVLAIIIYLLFDQIDVLNKKVTTLDVYRMSATRRIDQLEDDQEST